MLVEAVFLEHVLTFQSKSSYTKVSILEENFLTVKKPDFFFRFRVGGGGGGGGGELKLVIFRAFFYL